MTLRDLISIYGNYQEDFSNITDRFENPQRKIRLCFDDRKFNPITDNVMLPAEHPALVAWYDYEILSFEVPKKDIINVCFSKVYLSK